MSTVKLVYKYSSCSYVAVVVAWLFKGLKWKKIVLYFLFHTSDSSRPVYLSVLIEISWNTKVHKKMNKISRIDSKWHCKCITRIKETTKNNFWNKTNIKKLSVTLNYLPIALWTSENFRVMSTQKSFFILTKDWFYERAKMYTVRPSLHQRF